MVQPLAGVRVLELAQGVAGPWCGKLLAALGADVVKVEPPGGDPARHTPPFYQDVPGPERSLLFLYLNTGKRSAVLDVTSPQGREALERLLGWADVVVESFGPREAAALRLDYATLAAAHPRLVVTSLTPFGQWGPYAAWQATDLVALALGGLLYICGDPEREPLAPGGEPASYLAALSAFTGTLAALAWAEGTGEGQQVDVSAMEVAAFSQMYSAITYAYTGQLRRRQRDFTPLFEARDGQVGILYHRQAYWAGVCRLLERPDLEHDPRFATEAARRDHSAALRALVQEWVRDKSRAEVYHRGQALRVPVGYVCYPWDLLESPQYRARGYFVEVEHPTHGRALYPGFPFRLGEGASPNPGRAPLLGEHTEAVVAGALGLEQGEATPLRQVGDG